MSGKWEDAIQRMLRGPYAVMEDLRTAFVHPVDDRVAAHHLDRIVAELDERVAT